MLIFYRFPLNVFPLTERFKFFVPFIRINEGIDCIVPRIVVAFTKNLTTVQVAH